MRNLDFGVMAMDAMRELMQGDVNEEFANRFRYAARVAWDTETSGLDPRSDRLASVQLHAAEIGTVVIQLGEDVPWRLRSLLEHRALLKVFHHAMFDLRFMVAHWQATPRNVACTKVASKLLSPRQDAPNHS